MSLELYLGFIVATLILCVIPGPVVTYLVACGIRQGPRAAMIGLAGTTTALCVHMTLTVLGLAPLLAALGPWGEALKLIGAAYLVWIGIAAFRAPYEDPNLPAQRRKTDSHAALYRRGFLISVTNPKTLAFYAAFFPQFISPAAPAMPQLLLLAATFIAIGTLSDGAFGLAAGKLAPWLKSERAQAIRNRITGSVLIGAGIGLALARK
ncbi:MAG: LysE family translocator [Parvibaculum sp.]|uniref:LysE family translocator n=1 Tax=Parvibaculum sp. TaxID=2024848 RepID=UPI0027232675|nr:LysE family translocator [Parvibaculum sp.]MDO8837571.1 LysE family translocator [Parvibaculum sp.]